MTATSISRSARTSPALFGRVRALTEQLTEGLSPEDMTPQSMPEASPVKWHLAHTTWFFEEFVLGRTAGHRPVDPAYRFLFNSYYEAVGERQARPERGLVTRPGVEQVRRYRATVTGRVLDAMDRGELDDDALALVELGCHHEQQHQELLLMDLKHLLSRNALQPVHLDRPADDLSTDAPALSWEAVPEGLVEIGHDGTGFSYDNETPRHRVWLAGAELASRPVSNAEWLRFIEDDGYRRPELWLSDGWAAVQEHGWQAPGYWRPAEDGRAGQDKPAGTDGWTTFTLSGRRPVVPAEPVCHVSFFEADAYARWAGARLPTEAEWERWAAARPFTGELDPSRAHPRPVRGPGLGEVWEWTSSAYLPYPGFTPAAGAVGEYNGKFMNDQHVLRGAGAVTPAGHSRASYRNFFPAASRWVFSGLRLTR